MDDIFDNHIDWQTERVYGPIPVYQQEDMSMPNAPIQVASAKTYVNPIDANATMETPYVPKSRASMANEMEAKGIIATPSQAAKELLSLPVSTVKGAVQGFLGLPGDLETLLRGVVNMANDAEGKGKLAKFLDGMHQDTVLPTTERIKEFLDDNSNYFKGLRNNPMQTVGEILAPGGYVKATKAIKPVSKIATPIAVGTVGNTTEKVK